MYVCLYVYVDCSYRTYFNIFGSYLFVLIWLLFRYYLLLIWAYFCQHFQASGICLLGSPLPHL
jgi:hypothetical protein